MKRKTPTHSQSNCSRRGWGVAIFDTRSHVLHLDVSLRRKPGPWQRTQSYNSWKAIKGWELSPGQRPCQNPRVSFISCFCLQSGQTKGTGSSGGNATGGSKLAVTACRGRTCRTCARPTHRCFWNSVRLWFHVSLKKEKEKSLLRGPDTIIHSCQPWIDKFITAPAKIKSH